MKTITIKNNSNKQNTITIMSIYIHYIMTYIPIIGSLLGGFILSNQLLSRKTIAPKFIYITFIFSAICSIYNYSITKFENLHFSKQVLLQSVLNEKLLYINLSVFSLFLLGISSIIGLYLVNRNYEKEISMAIIISIIALFSSIFLIRSEYIKPNWELYSIQIK